MHPGQPLDPATHVSYTRLTWTLVQRIQTVLRPEEFNECARVFYEDNLVVLGGEYPFTG
jgi:hypothetical protein